MKTSDLLYCRVLMPWRNLGCLGVKSADGRFYADLFLGGSFGTTTTLRLFVHDQELGCRRWYTLTWAGWELDRVEVTHPEQFARVARRTLQPYAVVERAKGSTEPQRCMCYPYVTNDGSVCVLARGVDDEGGDMQELDCDDLRPLDFQHRTGIPANDPLPVQS